MIAAVASDAGASCTDAPPLCPIDVVFLSDGLPEGVYYAGKKLTPWMSFDDRLRLGELESRWARDTPEKQAEYVVLRARRAGESLVVRWTCENGLPSTPHVLLDMHRETSSGSDLRDGLVPRAFIWGKEPGDRGHIDIWNLTHFLCNDALEPDEARSRSSNNYSEDLDVDVAAFGDEWLLPRANIRRLIFAHDLRRAKKKYEAALQEAKAAGVNVEQLGEGRPPRRRGR